MDRHDHKYLGRLPALLMALAALAEHAAGARLPVRCLVLWILGLAAASAHAYAIGFPGLPPCSAERRRTGHAPDDDLRLADHLRRLACVFRALAHRARMASAAPRGLFLSPRDLSAADRLDTLAALPSCRLDTS